MVVALSSHEKLVIRIIKRSSSKYTVTASWRGLEESANFIPPYSQNDLNNIKRQVGELDESGKLKASGRQLKTVGLCLFRSLFPSEEIRRVMTKCLSVGGGAVDVELGYDDTEIGRVPWELLHDGKVPLVASGKLNLVRVLKTGETFSNIMGSGIQDKWAQFLSQLNVEKQELKN